MTKKISAVLVLQKYYRGFVKRKKEKGGEMIIDSEKKENSKLADELFEAGNAEKEKKKNLRSVSLSKLDFETDGKFKKHDINDANMLDDLMNMDNKSKGNRLFV